VLFQEEKDRGREGNATREMTLQFAHAQKFLQLGTSCRTPSSRGEFTVTNRREKV